MYCWLQFWQRGRGQRHGTDRPDLVGDLRGSRLGHGPGLRAGDRRSSAASSRTDVSPRVRSSGRRPPLPPRLHTGPRHPATVTQALFNAVFRHKSIQVKASFARRYKFFHLRDFLSSNTLFFQRISFTVETN